MAISSKLLLSYRDGSWFEKKMAFVEFSLTILYKYRGLYNRQNVILISCQGRVINYITEYK